MLLEPSANDFSPTQTSPMTTSAIMGIDNETLVKVLNFLPYPLLVSEFRNGQQHNIFVNRNFVDEIGYTCDDIPTISAWFAMAYPDVEYRNSVISDWTKLVIEAKAMNMDSVTKQACIKTKSNGEKWFEVKASLYGTVNLVAFVNIDAEIMRERKLELLNENKDRTLSILSHDLRSPLTNLHSALELLTTNSLNESEKSLIFTKLKRQVFQMIEFLDTTLQWTRINFSEQKQAHEPVNLRGIIDNVLTLYNTAIEEKKQIINVGINLQNEPVGDPEVFSILLRNLVSNAIKYTPTGGAIAVRAKQDRNRHIIEVENSGAAISATTIDNILNKNYTSQRGTLGEKGLGVGLKLCLQLLERVKGKMEIETPSSDKTLFRVVVPAQDQIDGK
jgi:signal transduction histidine kinase